MAAWLVLATGTAQTATANGPFVASRARHDEAVSYRYVPPPPPIPVWQKVIQVALSKKGTMYRWGAKGPNNFDCSGLVQWSWKQVGIILGPDTYTQVRQGHQVPQSQVQAGDLVFPSRSFGSHGPGHVQLAISTTQVIEAPGRGMAVRVMPMPPSFVARRVT